MVAAFASIVATTFGGATAAETTDTNASVAMVSILFIVVAIVIAMAIGMNFHPFYLSSTTWMIIVGIYIAVASVTPVWILLQPRDYLSSFLLYAMLIIAIVGVVGAHPALVVDDSWYAFGGFEVNGTYLFPVLFTTVACGAISGFHSLVSSGTTSGATAIFAGGIAGMVSSIKGLADSYTILYTLLVLTYSAFCLKSLDTATRLVRFLFPMGFMVIVTISSLALTMKTQIGLITAGGADWGPYAQVIIAALLIVLAIVLVIEGIQTLTKQAKAKAAA